MKAKMISPNTVSLLMILIALLSIESLTCKGQQFNPLTGINALLFDSTQSFIDKTNSLDAFVDTAQNINLGSLKDYYRFQSFWSRRIGRPGASSYKDISRLVQTLSMAQPCGGADYSNWKLVGPKHVDNKTGMGAQLMGLINEVLGNPNDPADILIAPLSSGIWKYDQLNNSWYNVTDNLGLPGIAVTEIMRNKFDPNYVIASTGVGPYGERYGVGIIESFDGGQTWSFMNGFLNYDYPFVSRIIQDPNDQVASDGLTLFAISDKAIFKSTNTGNTWTQLFTPTINQFSY